EANVPATGELVRPVDLVLVGDAHSSCARALVVVAELQPAEDLAADALQRRGREHAFRRTAAAHDRVQVGAGDRYRERADDVAVLDEVDARARVANVVDELL